MTRKPPSRYYVTGIAPDCDPDAGDLRYYEQDVPSLAAGRAVLGQCPTGGALRERKDIRPHRNASGRVCRGLYDFDDVFVEEI